MEGQVFEIVFLFAIFGSFSCLGQEYGNKKIGERCVRDRNCIQHAFCRVQMTCLCDQYYSPSPDKSMCIATEGLFCTNDVECRTMANAECRQGKCTCKDSYVLDTKNSSNCITRPSKEGDPCQRNDDCQEALGHAMCIGETCRCITHYHFVNATRQCVQTRLLYTPCRIDYECKGFNNEDILECRNGECACKQGEGYCNKAPLYSAIGIPVMLLLLLQRLI